MLAIWCASSCSTFFRNLIRKELLKISPDAETSDTKKMVTKTKKIIFLLHDKFSDLWQYRKTWFSQYDGNENILEQMLIGDWIDGMVLPTGHGFSEKAPRPSRRRTQRRRFICALWRHFHRFVYAIVQFLRRRRRWGYREFVNSKCTLRKTSIRDIRKNKKLINWKEPFYWALIDYLNHNIDIFCF